MLSNAVVDSAYIQAPSSPTTLRASSPPSDTLTAIDDLLSSYDNAYTHSSSTPVREFDSGLPPSSLPRALSPKPVAAVPSHDNSVLSTSETHAATATSFNTASDALEAIVSTTQNYPYAHAKRQKTRSNATIKDSENFDISSASTDDKPVDPPIRTQKAKAKGKPKPEADAPAKKKSKTIADSTTIHPTDHKAIQKRQQNSDAKLPDTAPSKVRSKKKSQKSDSTTTTTKSSASGKSSRKRKHNLDAALPDPTEARPKKKKKTKTSGGKQGEKQGALDVSTSEPAEFEPNTAPPESKMLVCCQGDKDASTDFTCVLCEPSHETGVKECDVDMPAPTLNYYLDMWPFAGQSTPDAESHHTIVDNQKFNLDGMYVGEAPLALPFPYVDGEWTQKNGGLLLDPEGNWVNQNGEPCDVGERFSAHEQSNGFCFAFSLRDETDSEES
ncbi:hypothetical protein C8F01DRAFT_1114329 [Mycena amicta]|nr:hypothetical protein C8F01DRAFT_1114329 [Mycena amicta]